MKTAKVLRIYLHKGALEPARAGKMRFIRLMQEVMQDRGFRVEYRPEKQEELLKSAGRNGYSLFHMKEPFHERSLTFRKVYLYPFWQIENTAKRWKWRVAKARFPAEQINAQEADKFVSYWRRQLFANYDQTQCEDYIFVPLQGRLLQHRRFQSMTPIEMIETTLSKMPNTKVIATLHPNEVYSLAESQALTDLETRFPLFELSTQDSNSLLQKCKMVVAQNSGMAFHGFFLNKPTVLFGQIDFHHIAGNVFQDGIDAAFEFANSGSPEFEKYMFWFLKSMSINAGMDDVKQQITDAFVRHGWDL